MPPHIPHKITRAKPLLGTLVEIRAELGESDAANAAIDRGFAAVAEIHRLMSFHEHASDVSRLNRDAAAQTVTVDPRTFEVLRRALEFSARSDGLFDITAGARLVTWGFLPAPEGAPSPSDGSWKDIVLEDQNRVRFRKPLWIDLGGIAKGFAVDQAVAAMGLTDDVQVYVNAGGDLRVAGPHAESVRLRTAIEMDTVPVIEIEDGALASSSGREHLKSFQDGLVGPHVGRRGISVGADSFVSVAAPDCLTADALTKVVLGAGPDAEPVLGHFGAIAYFYAPGAGWVTLGA
ncbi:MAG: FAD:protein FMN transferase [Rhodospirillaceae bacterium]|nr:FAD:protein FMN transferase [Rhodospirillaceae bacterium]